MRIVTYFIALLLIIVGASFAALNAGDVSINFYWSSASLPLSLLLAIAFVLGGVIGMFVCAFVIIKQKAALYNHKRKLNAAEKELVNLRSLPIRNKDIAE